jgi:hypothetical protein
MHTNKRCLELIAEVRKHADPESAYLLRSRVGRIALSAARNAARSAGADAPVLPREITSPPSTDTAADRVLAAASRVVEVTRTLCQPSEALDSRWHKGWDDAMQDLARLESAVRELGSECL